MRLIERGSRTLRLTEEGRALHERTRALMAEIQEAGEAVASRAPVPRGRLRISAPIVFAHVVLCPIAARFALAYPQVELEVVAEDRVVDPVEDGYDLVIRIDPPLTSGWWGGAFSATSASWLPRLRCRCLRPANDGMSSRCPPSCWPRRHRACNGTCARETATCERSCRSRCCGCRRC